MGPTTGSGLITTFCVANAVHPLVSVIKSEVGYVAAVVYACDGIMAPFVLASPNVQRYETIPDVETGVNTIASFTQAGLGARVYPGFGSHGTLIIFENIAWQPAIVVTVSVTVLGPHIVYIRVGVGPLPVFPSPNVQ